MPKKPRPLARPAKKPAPGENPQPSARRRGRGHNLETAGPSNPATIPAPPDGEPDGMSTNSLPFPMVGIGASAGGFESVMKLLKILPPDTGMAFVVVLHLDPRHESTLTELVARATPMPTVEIKDEVAPEPNHIYVLPANRDVILHQRRLRLVRRPDTERLHMPVDHFFSSLAQEQGSRAIGVVLSGTGSDGTARP